MTAGRRLLSGLKVRRPWQAELYLQREVHREVAWAEGRPKDTVSDVSEGVSLRAFCRGRQGFAFVRDIAPAAGRALWDRAAAIVPWTPIDKHRRLYAPTGAAGSSGWAGENGSGPLFRHSVKDLQDRLKEAEASLLRADRRVKKVLNLSVDESETECSVVSTEDVSVEQRFRSVSLSLELMGESRGEVQVAWDSADRRGWETLPWDTVLETARERLLRSFGARPLRSGRWPVIFSPKVGVEFLELWSEAVCADAVQDKRSFLAGHRGGKVASELVTLVDDGRYPGGMASAAHDDEGHPTGRTVVVERGRLRSFLYDTYAARREKRSSTGNAVRDGVEGPPSPHTTNFYLQPGETPLSQLFGQTSRAFLVEEVMGLHTADPVSGDFSVGASGALVENGRPGRAVKGVTLAGNFLDLFRRVDGVADDLTWYGSSGSPSFRVSGLSVGGK